MYLSILAGIFISLGCIVYLSVGSVAGALLFAVGLCAVLHFKAELFTGKVGLWISNEITPIELVKIYLGNFIGCACVACIKVFAVGAAGVAASAIVNVLLFVPV